MAAVQERGETIIIEIFINNWQMIISLDAEPIKRYFL